MDVWKSSEGAIELDASRWPLVWTKVLKVPKDDEFAALLEQLDAALRRATPYVIVTESFVQQALPISQLRAEAEWHRARSIKLARYCLGVGMVVPEDAPARKFAASTVKSMGGKQATPMYVFREASAALEWATRCLESAGKARA